MWRNDIIHGSRSRDRQLSFRHRLCRQPWQGAGVAHSRQWPRFSRSLNALAQQLPSSGADRVLAHDVCTLSAHALQSWTAFSCASWWTRWC